MNYPVWALPAPGLLIAAVGIVHVFISHFAVGGGLFLVLAETKARREGDGSALAFVRQLSKAFVLLTLVLGALTGVGIWFTIGLVQPQATSALVTTFVWVWAIEWTFFATEIAAALVYFYGWDRLDARTHLAVGWIYFVTALGSLVVITGILSFMMTSGAWPETHQVADGYWNPTFAPTVALRTAGALGLTGLYVLFAASFLSDRETKARVARWTASRFIAPAAALVPIALLWFLSRADGAGVAVAETLGAANPSASGLLRALATPALAGQPIVRGAGRVTLLATVVLVAGSLLLVRLRSRTYRPSEAGVLLVLGFVSIGGAEWLREGLRKPWVIDRYMFVNGVRVPGPAREPEDPFALDSLDRRGVLSVSRWRTAPAAYRPGEPAVEAASESERERLAAEAGREIHALECATCHTERGHLGLARLARGRSPAAIDAVLEGAAQPVARDGSPTRWSDPGSRVTGWLGRRMPPFAGTAAERRALALYVARLGGAAAAQPDAPSAQIEGAAAFETYCSACHGADAAWPIAERVRGRSHDELYAALGRLPELRPEMPPFVGSEDERRALAAYLADVAEVTR